MGVFLRLAALGIGLLISDWDRFGPVVERVWTKIDGLTEALGGMNGIITGIGGVMAGAFTLQVIGSLTTATAKASGLLAVLTQIGKLSALTVSIAVALYMFKKLEEISDATTQKDGTESFWESLKKRWKAGGWYNNEQQLKSGNVPLNPQSMSGPLMRSDATAQKGEIKVSFENAPPGMRVEPTGSALPWFDLDVGYNRFSTPK